MGSFSIIILMFLNCAVPSAWAGQVIIEEDEFSYRQFVGDIGSGPEQGRHLHGVYQAIESMLPKGSKATCVLKALDKKMGFSDLKHLSVGSSNKGANLRARSLLESSQCLATLAVGFYKSLDKHDKATISSRSNNPGWVWQKALEYSAGNRRLAAELIGLCLNDNLYPPTTFQINPTPSATIKGRTPRTLECPSSSNSVFTPGGLGESTMLDPATVRALEATFQPDVKARQAIDGGFKPLPPKEYHTYTAATIGCELSTCGLSATETELVQDLLARAYRGKKLCDLMQASSEGKNVLPGKIANQKSEELYNEQLRQVRDAATLFRAHQSAPGGLKQICTFANYSGPTAPAELDKKIAPGFLTRVIKGNDCAQREWSNDRCEKALRKLQTWEADELWTRAQHKRGSKFGYEACRNEPPIEDINHAACSALSRMEQMLNKDAIDRQSVR
jgi:hypothetical protein